MQHGIVGAMGAVMSVASLLGGGTVVSRSMDEASRQTQVHVVAGRLLQMEGAVELARLRMGRGAVPLGDMASLTPRYLERIPVAETIDLSRQDDAESRSRLVHDLEGGDGPAGYILMPLGDGEEARDLCSRIADMTGATTDADDARRTVSRSGCMRRTDGWSAWRRLS